MLQKPYSEERDIAFFSGSKDCMCFVKEKMFLVCMPHDAHKPGIMNDQPSNTTKLIIKIAIGGERRGAKCKAVPRLQ